MVAVACPYGRISAQIIDQDICSTRIILLIVRPSDAVVSDAVED